MSMEMWDKVIATNLRGPFLCTRSAMRIMKSQGSGRILNIGSISAQRPRLNSAPYASSKFGLRDSLSLPRWKDANTVSRLLLTSRKYSHGGYRGRGRRYLRNSWVFL